ncbi:response regulator transcription factor [Vallitalea sp.]|jgi:DNA-binding response OmpR family regulator|uniref:response regulator transcription factor n=1 Tax=Vallitalea sp. TaxID=1882829 RepID=UPI0025CFD4B3|nr:response regulator transcription factor [Vallitalea sp.]MCT4688795.1 response regulator transcription factor [Vallitalea sp.]
MNKNILVVEDDQRMLEIICDYLEIDGFTVFQVDNGIKAMNVFENNNIDLVLLDIMIPGLDGWSVCRRIRKKSNVLIIILSARSDEDDKLLGFELGADEYVTKPFSPKVLVARVKTLLSRFNETNGEQIKNNIISRKEIVIDKDAYSTKVNGEEIIFTRKEYDLLLLLIENEGIVLSRDKIINHIWGYDYYGDGRVVDTNIKTIRKKLGQASKYINTVVGIGYKFEVV